MIEIFNIFIYNYLILLIFTNIKFESYFMKKTISKTITQSNIQSKRHTSEIELVPLRKANLSLEVRKALEYLSEIEIFNTTEEKNYKKISIILKDLYEIKEPNKKINFCKEILNLKTLNKDTKKYLLKKIVKYLTDLPHNKKIEFINFSVENFGEDNLYNPNAQKKEDRRNLKEYIDLLGFDSKRSVAGKNIFLIGGGQSQIQKDLPSFNITNCDIRKIEDNPDIANKIITQDFCIDNFKNVTNTKDNQNEIWALYSLPMYATSLKSVEKFFINSVDILDNNGRLRVFPKNGFHTNTAYNGAYELIAPDLKLFEEKILETIQSKPDLFNLDTYSRKVSNGIFGKSYEDGYIITIKDKEKAFEYLKEKIHDIKQDVINQSSREIIDINEEEIEVKL